MSSEFLVAKLAPGSSLGASVLQVIFHQHSRDLGATLTSAGYGVVLASVQMTLKKKQFMHYSVKSGNIIKFEFFVEICNIWKQFWQYRYFLFTKLFQWTAYRNSFLPSISWVRQTTCNPPCDGCNRQQSS